MPDTPPNIILITTDQQRYDTCGPRAPSFMRTPHFDIMAREGITFSRAYTDCPICIPTRLTIMTGRHSYTHGMLNNGSSSDVIGHTGTLPARLRELGYQTLAVGKMHFNPQRARHGFDETIIGDDYFRWMLSNGYNEKPARTGLGQNELYAGMSTVSESLTLTNWIVDQCVNFIHFRRDPTRPFFLWCSFGKPHPPFDPPEPYYSMYRNCPIPDPVYGDWSDDAHAPPVFRNFRKSWSLDLVPVEVIREARAAYYGLITQIDYNMARIFAAMLDKRLDKDTMVVYASDHGEFLGDFHTGCKIFAHEPSAHIPLVMKLPQGWNEELRGTTNDRLVCLADILPTLVAVAGGKTDGVDGQNLIDLVSGKLASPRQYLEITASLHGIGHSGYWAITDGRWKYLWYTAGGHEQLFDLETDPQELKNLAPLSGFKDKKNELCALLVQRLTVRKTDSVCDGKLVSTPEPKLTDRELRSRPWPGYHTEYADMDVRH